MRILLDEMGPRRLGRELTGHDGTTVPRAGWASLKNGELLDVIDALFDVFITMDAGMCYQQRVMGRPFGIIALRAQSNDIINLIPLVPWLMEHLATIQSGEMRTVGAVQDKRDQDDGREVKIDGGGELDVA